MNPSLPPKKRESRQGSSEQRPPEDEFKYPAPLRHRRQYLSEGQEHVPRGDKEFLPPPPPPPPPQLPALPFPLSWQLPYHSSLHHPYLSGQVRERRGSGSPSWRDGSSGRRSEGETEPPIPHHSRWLRGEINSLGLHPSMSMPTYKGTYAVDSRDMWPYFRRDYASSLFPSSSSSHLFPQTSLYHNDFLSESRLRYSSRRHNGLDGQGIRSESSGRVESGSDSQPRVGGSHSNGRKKNQEDLVGRDTRRVSPSQVGPNAHSFHHNTDRDSLAILKPPTPHTYTSETRKTKASHEPSVGSASQSGAQIYYALGSLYSSVHHNPQAYPSFNPSGPPPSPLRNSQHSPHGQHNNHGVYQERELSPGSYRPSVSVLSGPDPPTSAVLPHFAKGSLIELAGGRLKRVEELQTEDFLHSADTTPEFHLSTCTILLISPGPTDGFNHLQVLLADCNTQELLTVLEEYPFFVRDRGWSSCSPQRSAELYGLHCRQLSPGDVCLALTPTPTSLPSTATTTLTPMPNSLTPVATLASSVTSTMNSLTPSLTSLPPPMTSSIPTPTSLQQLSCSRISAGSETSTHGSDRTAPPLATSLPSDSRREIQDKPRSRKRRWSAPELHEGNRSCTDLPQGCKRMRQQ
ncbi:ataxin-1 [Ictalurus punctatus]|uniref:Ataxin-1 n=1 Tax=Ictalurus punctatus TaxID=7998 RepID=A0A2D0SHR1_ICTPU|nr:ataxin-1 [Ictalurus punctatus]XP_017342245.1 ataxin-1 [Ictalurus punctatus]